MKGIFCIEAPWESDLRRRTSVLPLLQLLEQVRGIPYIHRTVTNREAVIDLLGRWGQARYREFPVGYFAFHGSPGTLHVGRRRISLDEFGEVLKGRCRSKSIFFGSCGVINLPGREIETFRRTTGAKCVAGYTEDVDWIESAALDLQVLDLLSYFRRSDAVQAWLNRGHRSVIKRLGFKLHWQRSALR